MSSTVFSARVLKARKVHRCYLCGLPIAQGEVHERFVGVTDGDFWTDRRHAACQLHTRDWTDEDWEYHEHMEFRKYILGIKT